jgi:hypothetical protein
LGNVSLLSFYLFITVLVRSQAVAAAWLVGIQLHMKYLEKFPIIFGGDLYIHEYASYKKKEGFQGLGGWGHSKKFLSEFG